MEDFRMTVDEFRVKIKSKNWTTKMNEKAQANVKATTTLQYGLSLVQSSKTNSFKNAKKLRYAHRAL